MDAISTGTGAPTHQFGGFSDQAVEIAMKSPLVSLSELGRQYKTRKVENITYEQPEHPDIRTS